VVARPHRDGSLRLVRQRTWPSFLLAAVATVSGFVLAEGLLRWTLPPPVSWRAPQERYRNHPTRLFDLRPNQQVFTHDKPARINALGFRGAEIESPKPEGRFRIVVMGDSVTFGNGVGDEQTYPAQLARKLGEASSHTVEVINAGIPGYDTWQHALLLEEVVLLLDPDLVLLGFYENDITQRPEDIRPVINERGESPRIGLGAWLGDRWIFLLKKSRVLLLAREAYDRARARWFPSYGAAVRKALLNGNRHPALEAGWKEVDHSLHQMSALLKREEVPFRVVVFPMPEQVWSTATNNASYQARLQAITNQMAVPTLDLLPAFRAAVADGRALYIPWDWHPNPEGHRVAAEAIEAFIRPVVVQGMLKLSMANSPRPIRTTPPGA
jgi:lysophospholipase L1-like esterase